MNGGGGKFKRNAPRPVCVCECGNHAFAPLTKGFMVMVSPGDAELLGIRWKAHVGRGGYVTVMSPGDGAKVLARVITDAPRGKDVDHVNHQTTDNRRENLRVCSHAENMGNRRHPRLFPTGISKVNNRFRAQLCRDGQQHYLGLFDTPEDAHAAYLEAARAYDSSSLARAA